MTVEIIPRKGQVIQISTSSGFEPENTETVSGRYCPNGKDVWVKTASEPDKPPHIVHVNSFKNEPGAEIESERLALGNTERAIIIITTPEDQILSDQIGSDMIGIDGVIYLATNPQILNPSFNTVISG